MKGRNLIITALATLAAGVALIVFRNRIESSGVVLAGGVLFILCGVLNITISEGIRKKGRGSGAFGSTFSWITSAGAVILGLCMLIFQATFLPLVPVMFGILVGFAALYQFYILAVGARPAPMPGWLYILPTLMAGGAVYVFMQKPAEGDVDIMLVSGVSLAIFGVAAFIEAGVLGHYNRHPEAIVDHARKEVEKNESEHHAPTVSESKAPETTAENNDKKESSSEEKAPQN